jgi:hypothetical protein
LAVRFCAAETAEDIQARLSYLIVSRACDVSATGEVFPFATKEERRGESMAVKIEVEKMDATHFRVRATEAGSESTHQVTLDPKDFNRLAGKAGEPRDLIRKSFEFLLEREPKESILGSFDLTLIARYFPEYEREIKKRLL